MSTVEGLRVAAPGLDASVERVEVDVALWSSLARLGLDVERIRIARRRAFESCPQPATDPAQPSGPREPFAGLARVAKLPKWIGCARSRRHGRSLRRPPRRRGRVALELTLDAHRRRRDRDVRLDASPETRRDGEIVAASTVETNATARVAGDGRVTRLGRCGGLWPVDRDDEVRLTAEADLGADAERYRVDLDGPKERLVHAEVAFVPRVSLDGGFELNVTEGLVAAFARGRSTADVSGTASGTLHARSHARRADISATARARGDGWEALDPRLADLGALDLAADVDADLDHENLSVRMANAVLRSAAQGEVLRLAALQPLRFGLEDWLVEPERPGRARVAVCDGQPAARLVASASCPPRRSMAGA